MVQAHDHPALLTPQLDAMDMYWISGHAPELPHDYAAKTRYRQHDATCQIISLSGDNARFEFAEPQWAVMPGQSVVVYEGEICLGGGVIV